MGYFKELEIQKSHEKYKDNKDDTDAIILFVNYLLKIISESKSPFVKSEFIKKVFDPYFPNDIRYSEILVSKIPVKYRLDILIDTFRKKHTGNPEKLRIFFQAILKKLKPDEISQLSDVISEELEQICEESSIRETIQILPPDFWKNIEESVRIRIEHILTESIESGKYDSINKTCHSGALGTWARSLLKNFLSKNHVLTRLLLNLASDNKLESDYIFSYFFDSIILLLKDSEELHQSLASTVFESGLKKGDERFYNYIKNVKSSIDTEIINDIQEHLDNFEAKEEPIPEDDIPF